MVVVTTMEYVSTILATVIQATADLTASTFS